MGSRLSAENWIGEGLGILSRFGESALTLARLCEATGKTRGSFYHHFDSMESYVDSLLERWRLDHTESVISLANEEVAAQDRLARLEREVAGLDHRLDQIIRRWADYQPRAKVSVEAVDEIRVGYIAECLEADGFSPEHARSCAELEYLMFLGAQQRAGVLGSERSHVLQTMFRQAMQLYRD
ncbi:MAG: TetR/AcrR family transcriptional regulator, partial [Myxococcota bacterium]